MFTKTQLDCHINYSEIRVIGPPLLPGKSSLIYKAGGHSRQVQIHVEYSLLPDKIGLISQVVFPDGWSLTQVSLYVEINKIKVYLYCILQIFDLLSHIMTHEQYFSCQAINGFKSKNYKLTVNV